MGALARPLRMQGAERLSQRCCIESVRAHEVSVSRTLEGVLVACIECRNGAILRKGKWEHCPEEVINERLASR